MKERSSVKSYLWLSPFKKWNDKKMEIHVTWNGATQFGAEGLDNSNLLNEVCPEEL